MYRCSTQREVYFAPQLYRPRLVRFHPSQQRECEIVPVTITAINTSGVIWFLVEGKRERIKALAFESEQRARGKCAAEPCSCFTSSSGDYEFASLWLRESKGRFTSPPTPCKQMCSFNSSCWGLAWLNAWDVRTKQNSVPSPAPACNLKEDQCVAMVSCLFTLFIHFLK